MGYKVSYDLNLTYICSSFYQNFFLAHCVWAIPFFEYFVLFSSEPKFILDFLLECIHLSPGCPSLLTPHDPGVQVHLIFLLREASPLTQCGCFPPMPFSPIVLATSFSLLSQWVVYLLFFICLTAFVFYLFCLLDYKVCEGKDDVCCVHHNMLSTKSQWLAPSESSNISWLI